MSYVDGYILPVPKRSLRAYKRMAEMGRKIWTKHGALDYKECAGDDLVSKWGKPFTQMMKLKRGETVVFAYIVFKSRAHRDQRQQESHEGDERHGRRPRTCRST